MKSIRLGFLIATLAVVFAAAISRAQAAEPADAPAPPAAHGHEFGGFGGHMLGFYADYLNLTDAQQAQMKTIMHSERANLKPLMEQMHATRKQLKQYEEGAFDEAKVRALATQQSQAMVELTVAQTRIHSEMFQVLTADQQSRMKDLEARRAARMAKHRQGQTGSGTDQAAPVQPEQ